nr:hypothetical protein NG677_05810 [Methylobacterium sp. OTU13CASTA1]
MIVRGQNQRSKPRPRASMPRLSKILCGLTLSVFGSGIAMAQYFDDRDMPIPPRAVVWRLNDRGFTAVTRPQFDGRAYVVEADDPYGERVRVFVDAHDGAILRRQRLNVALASPPVRVARPAPGYGWTEEEAVPRRPVREAERIIPPSTVPNAALRRAPLDAVRVGRAEPLDRNPMGLNPDAPSQAQIPPQAPGKVVRLNPPPKPAATRITPQAPRLSETPSSKPEVREPAAASLEAPKSVTPATNATAPTPAAVQPQIDAKAPKAWKDPPADQKKSVRVIGGATIVPGATPPSEPAKD